MFCLTAPENHGRDATKLEAVNVKPKMLSSALNLCGRRTLLWFLICLVGSLLLVGMEFGVTWFLRLLLKALGLAVEVQGISFLDFWQPSAVELAIFLVVVGGLRGAAQFIVNYGAAAAKERTNTRLRLAAVYDMLMGFNQHHVSAGSVNFNISEVYIKASHFFYVLSLICSFAIQSLILAAVIFFIAWREALTGFIGVTLIAIIVFGLSRRVKALAASIPKEQEKMINGIMRSTRNWMFIKIHRVEDQEHLRLTHHVRAYNGLVLKSMFWVFFMQNLPYVLGTMLLVIIIYSSLNWWNTDGFLLVAFLYLFLRMILNLGSLAGHFGVATSYAPQFSLALASYRRLSSHQALRAFEPLDSRGSLKLTQDRAKPQDSVVTCPPRIQARGLTFQYEDSDEAIIKNFHIDLPGGHQLGITGPSGSGKSTLMGVFLGVLQPSAGEIYLDGMPAAQFFRQPSMRVGYVGAEPFLFAGPLIDNLRYGCDSNRSQEIIEDCLEQAKIASYVHSLPDGLNSHIDENGDGISAGEKQRLCLARALAMQPHVLVLDEASANLDIQTESEIADALVSLKNRTTVIIVSHRHGMLKHCDAVIDMESQ